MTDPVEVTPEDREAYLSLNMLPEFDAIDVRAGRWDHVTGVQAFARHRTEALASQRALVEALERVLERGYVSEFIKEERGDHAMIVAALSLTKAQEGEG